MDRWRYLEVLADHDAGDALFVFVIYTGCIYPVAPICGDEILPGIFFEKAAHSLGRHLGNAGDCDGVGRVCYHE